MDCLAKQKFLKKIKKWPSPRYIPMQIVLAVLKKVQKTLLILVKLGAKLASLKLESFLELHIKNFPVLKIA